MYSTLCLLLMIGSAVGQFTQQFRYIKTVADNVELASPFAQQSWSADKGSWHQCSLLCNSVQNCTMLSFSVVNNNAICKLGSTNSSATKNVTGATMYYKELRDSNAYAMWLDPFRYRFYRTRLSNPLDAQEFCRLMSAALPVTFPSVNAYKTMQQFMSSLGPQATTVFVGITYTGNLTNGTMRFTTLRDWPIDVNPGAGNPNQPWAPGQPLLPPHSKPSDLAVMMSVSGWSVVNVAADVPLGHGVVCMNHTEYIWTDITERYYKGETTPYTRAVAEAECKKDDAILARAMYRPEGRALLAWARTKLGIDDYWIAGTQPQRGTVTWLYPDGMVFNTSERHADERQVWSDYRQANADANYDWCIREGVDEWWEENCANTKTSLCEGGF